jgi:hypothetical protein
MASIAVMNLSGASGEGRTERKGEVVKRFGWRIPLCIASFAVAAIGCGGESPWSLERTENAFGAGAKGQTHAAMLLGVPSVNKEGDPSCGDVATLALLRYWKWDAAAPATVIAHRTSGTPIAAGTPYGKLPDDALDGVLAVPATGATPAAAIRDYLNHESGLTAVYLFDTHTGTEAAALGTLEAAIDRGEPAIVAITEPNEGPSDPRAAYYIVVVGYDGDSVYAMDPHTTSGATAFHIDDFMSRWHGAIGADGKPAPGDVYHAVIVAHAQGLTPHAPSVLALAH